MKFPQTPDPDQTADAVKAVKTGKVNLADLSAAMRYVIENGGAVVLWELDLSESATIAQHVDAVIRPGELTIGEQCDVVDATGQGWDGFNPQTDPRHLRALLETVLRRRGGLDNTEATKVAETMTTDEFDRAFRIVEERPADPT